MSHWKNYYSPLDSEDEDEASNQRNFPKLSFGVELEFSLAALPLTREDHEPRLVIDTVSILSPN
jgi:hypothetical protein